MSCCQEIDLRSNDGAVALHSNAENDRKFRSRVLRLAIAFFVAGNSMLASLTFSLSELEPAVWRWLATALIFSVIIVSSLLAPPFAAGLKSAWQRRRLGVEGLFLLGILGAFGISLKSIVTGNGSVYFEVINILLVIYSFGALIKQSVQQRVASAIQSPLNQLATCVVAGEHGERLKMPVKQVQSGRRIFLEAGEVVPVDGRIVEGQAFVSESSMTGEPHLQPRGIGDLVLATSIVVDAPLVLKATRSGDLRVIDSIQRVMEKLQRTPSHWQSLAERIAGWFTLFVAAVAIATFAAWVMLDGVSAGLFTALAVLLVACPCAFGFATPIAVWQSNSRMFELGIAPQRGDLLERLAKIDTIAFDKTGTLTVVQPALSHVDVDPAGIWSCDEVLQIAAAVESRSTHPLAAAFHRTDMGRFQCESFSLVPAIGIEAVVRDGTDRHVVFLGRDVDRAGENPCHEETWFATLPAADESAVFVLEMRVNGELVARFQIAESSFDSVPAGMRGLEELGIRTLVLSGDSSQRVHELPAETTVGAMTPDDKLNYIRNLKSDGASVLYVGDGINDAMAMAHSDASIAVGTGSALLHETADAVWFGDDLRSFPSLISMARRTTRHLRGTLTFALVYNTIGMCVAGSGWLHPVFAAVLMLGSSLFVVLRSIDGSGQSAIQIPRDVRSAPVAPAPSMSPQLVQISHAPNRKSAGATL